ncbi:unnamed protein product [Meloidogyne enterolobii]|uniref:Uncharacterized protein n=1 Tax=Meloidogyne enterolobii TaxID=390850 RepID=A0ACB0YIQ8_MELEN
MSRTHVAMASTEKDRNKAIALTALLPAVGLLVGFGKTFLVGNKISPFFVAINAGTSYMKYPGIEIPLIKIHLNLFTAPMIFSMFIFLLALYLLIYHFDGKWHIYEKMQKINSKNNLEMIKNENKNIQCWIPNNLEKLKENKKDIHAESSYSFDWIAVLICCYTQLVISMAMLNLLTISSPYQQLAFQWDASQLQFYGGLCGVAVAIQLILWPAAYMMFGLNKIISERQSVMLGLIVLMGGYLFTYSWPFLSETFPYALNSSPSLLSSFLNNKTEIIENISNCGSESHPGCPSHYEWCGTTTKPNMPLYMASLILSTGMAMPVVRMNLDILYSKILGNIKQGVMQGIFFVCQTVLELLGGPIAVSWVFENYGPRHIWEFIGSQLILCLFCWIVFYKRMISKAEMMEKNEKLKNIIFSSSNSKEKL